MSMIVKGNIISTLQAQWRKVPLGNLHQWVFGLLLLVLLQQCAALILQLVSLATPLAHPQWQPSQALPPAQADTPIALKALSQLALFGQMPPRRQTAISATALHRQASSQPSPPLNAQLSGVMASSDPAKSIAIITMAGSQHSYGVGEPIHDTQAQVRHVYPDRVIITHDGRDETLMLDGEAYNQARLPSKGEALPSRTIPTSVSASTSLSTSVSTSTQLGPLSEHFTVIPVHVDGHLKGYRLTAGHNLHLFKQSGLQVNDLVIALNGFDLQDPLQTMQAIAQLTNARTLSLTIVRQGQPQDLTMPLSP
ncbi:MAG: type II secretion system protein GspC [Aeromonas sp.]